MRRFPLFLLLCVFPFSPFARGDENHTAYLMGKSYVGMRTAARLARDDSRNQKVSMQPWKKT